MSINILFCIDDFILSAVNHLPEERVFKPEFTSQSHIGLLNIINIPNRLLIYQNFQSVDMSLRPRISKEFSCDMSAAGLDTTI
jgi:hypothetical protein